MFCNPFSFKGRIRRTEYALSYIIFVIAIYSVSFLSLELGSGGYSLFVLFLACYWFLFSQGAKRCHDLGQSGYYQIIPFYVLVMVFSEGHKRTNAHGNDPKASQFDNDELKAIQRSGWKSLPEGKTLKLITNEFLSATLVAVFIIEILTLVLKDTEFIYFIEILVVAGCYFLLLLVSNNRNPLIHTSKYYVLHRASYSVLLYVFLWWYEVLFVNTTGVNYAAWFGDVLYITSFFIVTYLPYLIYKRTRKPEIVYAEV